MVGQAALALLSRRPTKKRPNAIAPTIKATIGRPSANMGSPFDIIRHLAGDRVRRQDGADRAEDHEEDEARDKVALLFGLERGACRIGRVVVDVSMTLPSGKFFQQRPRGAGPSRASCRRSGLAVALVVLLGHAILVAQRHAGLGDVAVRRVRRRAPPRPARPIDSCPVSSTTWHWIVAQPSRSGERSNRAERRNRTAAAISVQSNAFGESMRLFPSFHAGVCGFLSRPRCKGFNAALHCIVSQRSSSESYPCPSASFPKPRSTASPPARWWSGRRAS